MAAEGTATYDREPITEYLEVELNEERWRCRVCDHDLGDARGDYKRGLLLYDRDPRTIYEARIDQEYSYAPDPGWCRIVEYCCPGCATQVEAEYLPPGHPLTRDIELDVDALKARQVERKAMAAAAAEEG
jgi:acetone carboxylase gamma subunit